MHAAGSKRNPPPTLPRAGLPAEQVARAHDVAHPLTGAPRRLQGRWRHAGARRRPGALANTIERGRALACAFPAHLGGLAVVCL